jgi:hypothetical protein
MHGFRAVSVDRVECCTQRDAARHGRPALRRDGLHPHASQERAPSQGEFTGRRPRGAPLERYIAADPDLDRLLGSAVSPSAAAARFLALPTALVCRGDMPVAGARRPSFILAEQRTSTRGMPSVGSAGDRLRIVATVQHRRQMRPDRPARTRPAPDWPESGPQFPRSAGGRVVPCCVT